MLRWLLTVFQHPLLLPRLAELADGVSAATDGVRMEMHFTAIPAAVANDPAAFKLFDRDFMQRLEQMGYARARSATPWEAARISIREAVRAGMTPTINSLMVVGLVSLPGMMTGQILSGSDPRDAVRYQIVVMLMVSAAVAIGCFILVGLSYKKLFTEDGALKQSILQSKGGLP